MKQMKHPVVTNDEWILTMADHLDNVNNPVAIMPDKIEPSSGTDLEHQCQFPVQMKVILDLYSAE